MSEVRKITWTEWDENIRVLQKQIHYRLDIKDRVIKQIIGTARGGLIAAVQLSHLSGVPYRGTLHTRDKYHADGSLAGKCLHSSSPVLSEAVIKETLFVDDIVDTGETVAMIVKAYPGALVVAPTGKPMGLNRMMHNLYVIPPMIVQDDVWLEFPWES